MFSDQPNLMHPDRANGLADRAAANADADGAIEATRQAANNAANSAADGLSQGLETLRHDASTVLNRVSDEAALLRDRGLDALHEHQQRMRSQARQAGDRTVRYVREEPVKGLLIAAATGATLMAVLGWIGRSRRNH